MTYMYIFLFEDIGKCEKLPLAARCIELEDIVLSKTKQNKTDTESQVSISYPVTLWTLFSASGLIHIPMKSTP